MSKDLNTIHPVSDMHYETKDETIARLEREVKTLQESKAHESHRAADLLRERNSLKTELDVTKQLLAEYTRVLDAIPPCAEHGSCCVEHALEWLEKVKHDSTLAEFRKMENQRDEWKQRANLQLDITTAALALAAKPYQLFESRGYNGAYLIRKTDFENLALAVEAYKALSETEDANAPQAE